MAVIKEEIVLEVSLVDDMYAGITRIKKTMKDIGRGMNQITTTSFRKAEEGIQGINKTMVKTIPKIKKFKMEYLGVMFAGMALTRTFGGLLKAQMDLFGVSDMLSATWTMVLLPIMEVITPIIMSMLEAFMDMSDGAKMAIGIFILLAAGLGLILLIGGQLALGIGALTTMFGGLFSAGGALAGVWQTLSAVMFSFGAIIAAVAAIVIAVIVGMVLAWKENFLGMKQTVEKFVEGIKQWFGGIVQYIKGFMKVIKGLFTGDFSLILEGMSMMLSGIFDFIVGSIKATIYGVIAVLTGAVKIIWNIIKAVVDGVGWVVGKVGGFFGGSGSSGKAAWKMPSFQTGGVMPETGMAMLHKGERVLTAGETRQSSSGGSGTANITVNASVSNDYDVRRLADKLKEYWVNDFEKTSQGRTA